MKTKKVFFLACQLTPADDALWRRDVLELKLKLDQKNYADKVTVDIHVSLEPNIRFFFF